MIFSDEIQEDLESNQESATDANFETSVSISYQKQMKYVDSSSESDTEDVAQAPIR